MSIPLPDFRPLRALLLAAALLAPLPGAAQPSENQPAKTQAPETQPAEPQETGPGILSLLPPDSVTRQEIALGGDRLAYTATAGTFALRDRRGERIAAVYYTAYTLDAAAPATPPVTFVFNGGPGAASAYQIRRATCRESVCPYVMNSGGAVSLKKTN